MRKNSYKKVKINICKRIVKQMIDFAISTGEIPQIIYLGNEETIQLEEELKKPHKKALVITEFNGASVFRVDTRKHINVC